MRVLFLMKWAQDRVLAASIVIATIMVGGSMSSLLYVRCVAVCEVSLFTSIQIQIGFSVLWQTTYKMGTYQQSLLTHFPATEDVRTTTGRRQWSLMPLPLSLTLQVSMSMSQPQTRACPPRAQSSSRKTRRRVQMSTGHLPCRTRPRKKDEEESLPLTVHRQQQTLSGRRTTLLLNLWVRVWRNKGTQSRGTR